MERWIAMAKKTNCPITRGQFRENAQPLIVKIGDEELDADVKEFSTGSLGWYLNGKIKVEIGGVRVPVQVGMNLTVVGSKDLPKDDPVEETNDEAVTANATTEAA
ncbi:MAG: hypothetical protein ACFCD0_02805 [Gemmataceae bacterium]